MDETLNIHKMANPVILHHELNFTLTTVNPLSFMTLSGNDLAMVLMLSDVEMNQSGIIDQLYFYKDGKIMRHIANPETAEVTIKSNFELDLIQGNFVIKD